MYEARARTYHNSYHNPEKVGSHNSEKDHQLNEETVGATMMNTNEPGGLSIITDSGHYLSALLCSCVNDCN